jgi:hypothetical protein
MQTTSLVITMFALSNLSNSDMRSRARPIGYTLQATVHCLIVRISIEWRCNDKVSMDWDIWPQWRWRGRRRRWWWYLSEASQQSETEWPKQHIYTYVIIYSPSVRSSFFWVRNHINMQIHSHHYTDNFWAMFVGQTHCRICCLMATKFSLLCYFFFRLRSLVFSVKPCVFLVLFRSFHFIFLQRIFFLVSLKEDSLCFGVVVSHYT